MEEERKRTLQQNRALHKYFTLLAENLNNAGLDMRAVLKPGVSIPWNGNSIKEYIWKPIQEAQLGKKSTTELTTKEIDLVFDTINRHLGEKFGITEDFPSIEKIMFQMLEDDRHNHKKVKVNKK